MGTHADNMNDCVLKGRYDRVKRPKGEQHGNSVLTKETVLRLRREYTPDIPLRVYAEQYQVTLQTIHRIIKHQAWKHIAD